MRSPGGGPQRAQANTPTNRLTWWDAATGRKRGEWRSATAMGAVQFEADGRNLVAVDDEQTVYLLRLAPAAKP